jgi:hypothetical protein
MKLTTEAQRRKNAEYCRAWREANKDKQKAYQKKWHAENGTKRRYGITRDEREALFASQDFKCAVCGTNEPGSKSGWHTDHCHASGKVRGILCHHCNTMLGLAKDNPDTLLRAVDYLKAA